jgi:hypothetical protein
MTRKKPANESAAVRAHALSVILMTEFMETANKVIQYYFTTKQRLHQASKNEKNIVICTTKK